MSNNLVLSFVLFALTSSAVVSAHFGDTSDPYVRRRHTEKDINILESRLVPISTRLPNDTAPIFYSVSLQTAVHNGDRAFSGTTRIQVFIREETSVITLHAYQMTILSAAIVTATGDNIPGVEFIEEPDLEFVRILSPLPLPVTSIFTVVIEHTGLLREDDGGFYMSSYEGPTGIRYLATTQFQDIDARHAFPCYDEPGTRAPISLSITHDASYQAISSMPISNLALGPGNTITTQFETTPPMQVYILAFIVSDFTSINNNLNRPANVLLQSIHARPEFISRGDGSFALEVSTQLMPFLETLLGRTFALPKMDQAAIPTFAAGAMENYGLCTYRESILLYNRATQPMAQEKLAATVIAHEFAHQFFGNAVSPEWWTYIWLSEGFATLYEYYATHLTFPDYGIDQLYVSEVLHFAMARDNTLTIRPMTYYAEGRTDIFALFDVIAYEKSSAVLRMFMYALSLNTFHKGLNYYLTEMNNQAVNSLDLTRNLERAAREDNAIPPTVFMADLLHSWSEQPGYPILHVSRDVNNVVTLRQERFYNVEVNETLRNRQWWLPYNFASSQNSNFDNTLPDGWMTSAQNQIVLTSGAGGKTWTVNDWLVFNKQQTSYYRVNYDSQMWHLIAEELHDGDYQRIHFKSRAQLLDDSFKLARLNRLDYETVFELLSYLHNETEYLPWAVFNSNFGEIEQAFSGYSEYNTLKSFVSSKIEKYYNSLGAQSTPNDRLLDRYGRNIAITYACRMGLESCLSDTTERVRSMLNNSIEVEIDHRSQVYCAGLRTANSDLFLAFWNRLFNIEDITLRTLMGNALGCSEITANLVILLDTTLDPTVNYMDGERLRLLAAAGGNTNIGLEVTLNFIENNFQRIQDNYGEEKPLSQYWGQLGNRIVSPQHLARYRALGERLVPIYVDLDNYNTGLSNAQSNLVFTNEHVSRIAQWINLYIERNDDGGGANSIALSSFGLITAIVVFIYNQFN